VAETKFTVYYGEFPCHTCKEKVTSLRSWIETNELTWMCSKKHMSKVSLAKKTKKDYKNNE
jgi:hypothetical protein